ncbi:MAG: hypothetical protein HQK96_20735 [Nitrospirae bacterium]|nr:hypothetical protein [Nitrospirota bacterium]
MLSTTKGIIHSKSTTDLIKEAGGLYGAIHVLDSFNNRDLMTFDMICAELESRGCEVGKEGGFSAEEKDLDEVCLGVIMNTIEPVKLMDVTEQIVSLPLGCTVLSVNVVDGQIMLYARWMANEQRMVDHEVTIRKDRERYLVNTGNYLDTVVMPDGSVRHIFEGTVAVLRDVYGSRK